VIYELLFVIVVPTKSIYSSKKKTLWICCRHDRNADVIDLVTSDGISEMVSSLLTWLSTAESYLSEAKSVLGDVETVGMLTQQHQVCIRHSALLAYVNTLFNSLH